jgi:MSHA biogenesis protein MshJ
MKSKPASRMPAQLEKTLQQLQQRFEPLAQREKLIIAAAALALVVMLFQLVALDPLLSKRDAMQKQQEQLQQDFNLQQIERETLNQAITSGPKRQKQQQLEQLQQEVAMLDEQIARTTSTMIPPRKMTDVLREVMTLRKNLKLVELENLEPQPLLADATSVPGTAAAGTPLNNNQPTEILADKVAKLAAEETDVGLYRHGVKLVFEGNYMETMEFLESLEQKSWRFFWQTLQYDVEKYPNARVMLMLYTLSPERAWLGV